MDRFPDLKSYRTAKGLTQAQLAELISAHGKPVSQGRISQWEGNVFGITPKWATQIEAATGGELCRSVLIFGQPPVGEAA